MKNLIRKILYKPFNKLWKFMYPTVARKSLEEWNTLITMEFALKLVQANPESAEEIATYYLNRLNGVKNDNNKVRCWLPI